MEPVDTQNGALAPEEPLSAQPAEQSDTGEIDRLGKEKAELQELLQRRQAEFENFRRRSERERGEISEFAKMDVVKALFEWAPVTTLRPVEGAAA